MNAFLLITALLSVASARQLNDVSAEVANFFEQMKDYPLHPNADPAQVAKLLHGTVTTTDEPVEHVQVAWVAEDASKHYPTSTISILNAAAVEEPRETFAEQPTVVARRLNEEAGDDDDKAGIVSNVISGVTGALGNLAENKLEAASSIVAKAFGVFDDADRVLELDLDAQYNRTIAPLFVAPKLADDNDSIKVVLNITAQKNRLLSQICQPPAVTPAKRIPTRYVGPTARLDLVPASCVIEYFAFNKTRRFTCQPARLVLNKMPALANLAYNSSSTFRGPACIYSKLLGNITSVAFNGGELRVNVKEVKTSITKHFLRSITSLLDGSNPLYTGLDDIVSRLSDNAFTNIVGSLGSGKSLLDLLLSFSGR